MTPTFQNKPCTHTIDKNDIIIGVSDNWRRFAYDTFYRTPIPIPENVVGTSLWDHIENSKTRHFYEIMLQKVREHGRQATFSVRSDQPELRRFLKMSVIPEENGVVVFKNELIKFELRFPQELLRFDIKRADNNWIKICSMCKKIATSEAEDQWEEEEVEVAERRMYLYLLQQHPQLIHSVCPACYNAAMSELDRLGDQD